MTFKHLLCLKLACAPFAFSSCTVLADTQPIAEPVDHAIEEVSVWGSASNSRSSGYTSPVSVLNQEDLTSINVTTTEDIVKFEPSLVIRRRFIGDSNGTLGVRGSNMFQTSRSMVFADGVPLHYFLQSRWNGAPRWTMVSASEIAQVEVVYGPFSAEYSGNSMGGVVLIETAIPQEREFHLDGAFFSQDFDEYGFDDSVNGFKGFTSFGDKVGNWSYFLSYNHLENDSQPQTFRDVGGTATTADTPVTGGIAGNNSVRSPRFYYGDTGVVSTTTDNYKFKAGYEFGDWFALLNIAYEDRESHNIGNSYLKDGNGNTVWSGEVSQAGETYSVSSARLNEQSLDRDSLSVGVRLKGTLSENVSMEANVNQFSVLGDESRSSVANPNDPLYNSLGQIVDFGDTGWQTADVKFNVHTLGSESLSLASGLRWESYELNIGVFDSGDYLAGQKTQKVSGSGGNANIVAGFAQLNWLISEKWDSSFGLRAESWESENGYYTFTEADQLVTEQVPGTSDEKVSPKFSLGYKPTEALALRYSLAKANRFPIVEELYSQYRAYNTVSISNPELKPESGLHHNLMFEKALDQGYMRLNVYWENIKDVIESQTEPSTNVRTFVPVDEVETKGVEFIVNADAFLSKNLDARFNIAFTNSKIVKNDPAPELVGNTFTRMPKWRGNLLATYHLTRKWDVAANWQYASDSYGRLDNTDNENNVYGAQDAYSRFGVKTTFQIEENYLVGFCVDNITNEIDYVAHPWPARTVYLNFAIDM